MCLNLTITCKETYIVINLLIWHAGTKGQQIITTQGLGSDLKKMKKMYLVGIYSHRFEFVKLLGKKSLDPDPY